MANFVLYNVQPNSAYTHCLCQICMHNYILPHWFVDLSYQKTESDTVEVTECSSLTVQNEEYDEVLNPLAGSIKHMTLYESKQ